MSGNKSSMFGDRRRKTSSKKSSKKVLNKTGPNHDFSCKFLHDEERQTIIFQKNPRKWSIFCRFLRFLPIFLHFFAIFLKKICVFFEFFCDFWKKRHYFEKKAPIEQKHFFDGSLFWNLFFQNSAFFSKFPKFVVPFFMKYLEKMA